MPSTYLDFEVEVGHHIEQAHPIVVRSPAGQARHSARFPLTDAELESHLLKLENAILRSAGRRRKNPTPEDAAVQGFGQRLFDFLFSGEALSLYRECHRVAAAQGKGVRLKLNLQPPSLAVLPGKRQLYLRMNDN